MWQARVQRAIDLQNTKKIERQEILKLLKGEFFGNPFRRGDELSEINFVHEYLKVKVGGIYARDPYIFVRARSSFWYPFAETMQTTLNYYWRELQIKRKIKKAIIDGVLIPPGWVGIGYTGSLQTKRGRPSLQPELRSLKTEGQLGILDETIKGDDVFAKHISSWNVVWPDGYHDIRKAPYLIEIQESPLVDILNNPLYKDAKYDLKSTITKGKIKKVKPFKMSANIPTTVDSSVDDEIQTVKLFHIWDKRSHERFTLAENLKDDTLYKTEWDYLIEGFPQYPLIFNEVPQSDTEANSYPMSDIVPMLPQLRDLSIINSAILRHGKRHGSIILVKKGRYSEADITKIQQSGDLDCIELESLNEQDIQTFNTPSLPNDWYKIRALVIEDLMRISGFQQLLAQAQGIETATESENLRLGELLRRSESVDIIEDFTVDVARGLAGLIWQYIGRERISNIIGEIATEQMWPTLPSDMEEARGIIQQELQFRIEAGSTRPPKDTAVERKQWMDLTGTIVANFPNRIKQGEYLKQLLKKFDFKDVEDLIITNDDQEIAIAQEENKLLLQNIPQLVSPNENHILHLQVHGQVYQVPGLQKTPEFGEHVFKHSKYLEQNSPKVTPQRGDAKIAPVTTTPEMRRTGVPENVDLVGGATSVRGAGENIGGR